MKGDIEKINLALKKLKFKSLEEVKQFCLKNKIDVEKIVKSIQPIVFDNAVMAFELGVAMALKNNDANPMICAEKIGEALQTFCKTGSVAEQRKVGLGHGNLASRLLSEDTKCFCFLAGHESFAASEGAIGIVKFANKVRKSPLRVVLNGLGKDAAYIIARMNGFTFMETTFDQKTQKLNLIKEVEFSSGEKSAIRVYGSYDVNEGVAVMFNEDVDISITGNSTNIVRFTHPVAGEYKKLCNLNGKNYFSVASGGGTGRTMHPDNVLAGPASYGLTDTMGRMHCDVQFAGSSSVPAHVAMMGFIGMGNNTIVGATVALAVKASQHIAKK
ncbi:MAG: GGGtGRT protein [Clostridia bacterium]|nr:GGGtGRT protein [Clostridia bacterium]